MRRSVFILLLSLAAFFFVSCDEENYQHPDFLNGHWVSTSNAKEPALILVFDDYNVEVKNSSRQYKPFRNDHTWDYYMTRDSVLCLSRSYDYDSDGVYDSEYLEFELYLRNNGRMMTLVYTPLFGSQRTFTFIHR